VRIGRLDLEKAVFVEIVLAALTMLCRMRSAFWRGERRRSKYAVFQAQLVVYIVFVGDFKRRRIGAF
jgi:hypothetical protein